VAPADGRNANECAGRGGSLRVRDVRFPGSRYSYVVSGVGFLGAGVIFKDAGSVRGLNTAATLWCSAAIGAICGLGHLLYGASLAAVVLLTNVVLRPLAYRLYPTQQTSVEQEITYTFELICRAEDEAHIRALLMQAMGRSSLTLTALKSEDIEGTSRLKVSAQIRGLGRQDEPLEQLVARLSLESSVTSVSWAVHAQVLE
jgi:putative Mg2+ transporter-C (MgtC) family protein